MTLRDGEDGLISVVIPTYYRNDTLREALESVRRQTYDPVEVFVVDSSEGGVAESVVDGFDEATYVHTEVDEGPQAARSLGAERASGDYVQFLDDDDRLHPRKFEKQVPLIEPPVGVVYCGMVDATQGDVHPNPAVRGDVLERALEMRTFPCIPSTMLIDARVVRRVLPLQHRHGADDTGMKIELALQTEFDFVDDLLVDRGRTETALSESWAYLDGRWTVIDYYDDVYERFPWRVRGRAVRETHYQVARKLLEERGWSPRATLELARAAATTPENRSFYVGECFASVFGRRGVSAADHLLS